MNVNKVFLAGRLTRDPELKYTGKGTAIAKFGFATNHQWRGENGESKEKVCFVEVDAFGKTAETINQYFKKGKSIFIEGRLSFDEWEEKGTGKRLSKLFVVLDSFQFVEPKAASDGND